MSTAPPPSAGRADGVTAALTALRAGSVVAIVGGDDPEARGSFAVAGAHATRARMSELLGDAGGTLRVAMPASRLSDGEAGPLVVGCAAGGVIERPRHAETAVDLARAARLDPVVALCAVTAADGRPAPLETALAIAGARAVPVVSVAEVIGWRLQRERLLARAVVARLPLAGGAFRAYGYRDAVDGSEHLALALGDLSGRPRPPVHVHVRCFAGDVLRATACGCRWRLEEALARIAGAGRGLLVYVNSGPDAPVICTGERGVTARTAAIGDAIAADLGVCARVAAVAVG